MFGHKSAEYDKRTPQANRLFATIDPMHTKTPRPKIRLYIKVAGIVLLACGLLPFALAVSVTHPSFASLILPAIAALLGLLCLASPQITLDIVEVVLGWLP